MGVLRAENVRKSYGETIALDSVSLSVSHGEVFGLIGPNGAGKTTLVRALTGTTPVEGTVRVLGSRPTSIRKDRIGLLPQSFDPPDRLTAYELVEYYAGLYDDPEPTAEVLESVGMDDRADTWYGKLSGGQKRRTCVGITLVNDPDVLFLDEPTTGIDPAGRRALWELLERLAAGGTTILLTSHSMEEVQALSDRVGLLQDGRLVAVGEPSTLIETYGGDSRLVIETAGVDVETAQTAVERAGFSAHHGDDEIVVTGVSPVEISTVVETIETAGIEYGTLTWTEPTLEDVYLELTGEVFEGSRRHGGSRSIESVSAPEELDE